MNKKTLFSWIFVFMGLALIAVGFVFVFGWFKELEFFNRISQSKFDLMLLVGIEINFLFALKNLLFSCPYKGSGLKLVDWLSVFAFAVVFITVAVMAIKTPFLISGNELTWGQFYISTVGFPSLAMLVIRFFAWLIFGVIKPLRLKKKVVEGEE
jgi:hypothetical protein